MEHRPGFMAQKTHIAHEPTEHGKPIVLSHFHRQKAESEQTHEHRAMRCAKEPPKSEAAYGQGQALRCIVASLQKRSLKAHDFMTKCKISKPTTHEALLVPLDNALSTVSYVREATLEGNLLALEA